MVAERERALLSAHESTWLRGLTDKDTWWLRRPMTVANATVRDLEWPVIVAAV